MKKYFSRGLLASFIIASVFSLSSFINITPVSAQMSSLCAMIESLISTGIIPSNQATAARAVGRCSNIIPIVPPAPTPTPGVINKSDSRFGIEGTRIEIFDEIQALGIGMREAQGVHITKWGIIESKAPINGVPTYLTLPKGDWGLTYLKQVKDSGIDFSAAIEFDKAEWALEKKENIQVINPANGKKMPGLIRIKPEHEQDYKNFIKHYISVMPNLRYIQVDNEPENIWVNGEGYYRAIELTKEAVIEYEQKTGHKVTVMAAGFNLGLNMAFLPEDVKDYMYKNHPNIDHEFIRRRINEELIKKGEKPLSEEVTPQRIQHISQKIYVVMTVLNKPNPAFDIFTIHLDQGKTYDYANETISWYKSQMQKNGYNRPLWIDDMSNNYIPTKDTDEDKKLMKGLESKNTAVIKEHTKRQSAWLLRKISGHFSSGAEKVKIAYDMEIDYYMPEWRQMGLFFLNGREKPSYYSAKIIINKLDYFKTVTKISLNAEDYLYKFTFANKPDIYVAWTEPKTGSENWNFEIIKTIDLSKYIQGDNVEITYLVNSVDKKNQPITKPNKVVSVKQVPLSSEPIFISPTLNTPTIITNCILDPIKYANHYPDLKKAFGSDKVKLKQHWLNFGIKEGRTPCGSDMPTCKADDNNYLKINPDVATAGMDPLIHYKVWGINEGRVVCQTVKSASIESSSNYATALYSWETVLKLIQALR